MTEAGFGRRGTWAILLAALVGAIALALALAEGANAGAVDCSLPDPDGCAPVEIVIVGSGSGRVVEFNDGPGGIPLHDTNLNCRTGGIGVCAEEVPIDVHVGLIAIPDAGSEFIGWAVVGDAHFFGCGQQAACYPAPNGEGPVTVIAEFDQTAAVPLTVVRVGTAAAQGFVSSSPPGIYCGLDCTDAYPQGSTVTLTAVVPQGVTFSWGGDCAAFGSNKTCVLTMTGVKSVVATFNAITYPLSVTVVGKGHVSSDQPDIHCPEVVCTANFAAGTQVTLRATPDAGWEFAGWSGACTGTTACVVTMTQARSVTATFVPAEVQARVVRHNIVYTANNRRQLRVTVDADEDVRVVMKIRRGGVTLQQRTARVFGPDVRVLRMNILQDIRAGTATLRVTFTNDARAQETVVHTLKIPQPKQLG